MAKVSVIIAAHNAANFIHYAIESVLGQTHRDVEVIVTDDGSTDDTAKIVQEYAIADHRVSLFTHNHSQGPSTSRNTGIENATGEWIAILDADDMFPPDRLANLLREAEKRQLDVVADMIEKFDFDTRKSLGLGFDPAWFSHDQPVDLTFVLERDWPGKTLHSSLGLIKPMLKRAFLQAHNIRYEPKIRVGEDILLYAELILSGARFGLTNISSYRYFLRPQSISFGSKPTTQLVEVNRLIGLKAMEKGVLSGPLEQTLKARERSLWRQNFVWSVKRRMFGSAAISALHLPSYFFLAMAVGWTRRLFTRRKSRAL